jgi:hypothetical protein
MDGASGTVREALNDLIKEQKEINKEKGALTSQMRSLKADVEAAQAKSH